MKSSRLLFSIGAVFLLFSALTARAATIPTPANGARGVYMNGKVYRVLRNGGILSMQVSTPQYPDQPDVGNAVVVDAASPVASTFTVSCQIGNHSYGGSIAVFNNRIYYAYTNQYGCYNNVGVYVATFDPYGPGVGNWTENRSLGMYGSSAATGTALATLNGTLYLFSAEATFSTVNPEDGWTDLSARVASPGYEPLDAVTIYPQNSAARVLIVLGKHASDINAGYYTELDYVVFDGSLGTPLIPIPIKTGQIFNGQVSLQMGTAYRAPFLGLGGFTGDKAPAVQLFGIQLPATNVWDRGDVVHFEYNIDTASWKQDTGITLTGADLWTYNWYHNYCDTGNPATQGLHQFFVVNHLLMSSASTGDPHAYRFDSDYLVPQNRINPITCTDTGGTNTPTGSMALDIARHYWTLVGVILGSPPFAVNHLPAASEVTAQELSNVDYAKETEIGVSHSQEWGKQFSMSAGLEVSAGFFGIEASNSFDVGYKHAEEYTHESESTGTVGHSDKMGTNTFRTEAAPPGDSNLGLGHLGWALFNAPMIKVQDYAVYSYDYNYHDGTGGVYVNQDLTMISGAANQGTMKVYAFDLNNPSDGDIPGLMANMPGVAYYPATESNGFPYSTDLASWSALEWESNTSPWEVKLGRGTYTDTVVDALGYGGGHNPGATFTHTDKDVTSSGETTSLSVDNTTSLSAEMGGIGIKATLKIGAESSFKTKTSDTTKFTQDVTAAINMGPCGYDVEDKSDCIKLLEVQPFILRATNPKAPWIPEKFQGQLPWAITWTVDTACTETAVNCPGLTEAASMVAGAATAPQGRIFGRSLPPVRASGRIVSGQGGGDPGDPLSHYVLQGGRLWWVDANGAERRIPTTADTFVPSQGVYLEIGGFTWSSLGATGDWKRSRDSWTFTSGGQVRRNRVQLTLDFGQATFDVQLDKVDFQGSIHAGVGEVPMEISVNGLYSFRTVLHHDFDVTWQLTQPPINNTTLQVTSFDGRYNNATGSGKMTLSGTLPAVLPNFGDLAVKMNDRKLLLPLLSLDGFQAAYEAGRDFSYVKEGLNLDLNFRDRTWSLTLNNKAFQKLLALRWGSSQISVNVGGLPWYNRDNAIVDFTANLTLQK